MLATSSFSLVLAETIVEVFVIDSEELQGIAVNLCLPDYVAHRHLDVWLTIAGVTHHDGNLFQWHSFLGEIRGKRTPAGVRRDESVLLSGLLLSSLEYLRVRIYSAFTADVTKGSVEGHLAYFARERLDTRSAYQERTELLVERNPYLRLGLL